MVLERILLQTIKFDLQVEHPYQFLLKYAKQLKGKTLQGEQVMPVINFQKLMYINSSRIFYFKLFFLILFLTTFLIVFQETKIKFKNWFKWHGRLSMTGKIFLGNLLKVKYCCLLYSEIRYFFDKCLCFLCIIAMIVPLSRESRISIEGDH